MPSNNIPDIGDALTNLPSAKTKLNVQPKDTSKGHFYVSLIKSFLRIIAGISLIVSAVEPFHSEKYITLAGALFIAAEGLGILEELV